MQKISNTKKGFTLVELLIVIGILAILATTAVVILNPAQLLAQARDSQRFNDLRSIESAIALYMTEASPIDLGACPQTSTGVQTGRIHDGVTTNAGFTRTASFTSQDADTGPRTTGGLGWVDIDFDDLSTGAPFSSLPIDPTNEDELVYRYGCNSANNEFALHAVLESDRYDDIMADHGDSADFYQVGTNPNL